MNALLERLWQACRGRLTRAGLKLGIVPGVIIALVHHQMADASSFRYGGTRQYTLFGGAKGWRYDEIARYVETHAQADGSLSVDVVGTSGSLENAERVANTPHSLALVGEAVAQLQPFTLAKLTRVCDVYPQVAQFYYSRRAYAAQHEWHCRASASLEPLSGEWTVEGCDPPLADSSPFGGDAAAEASSDRAESPAVALGPRRSGGRGPSRGRIAGEERDVEPLRIRQQMPLCVRRALSCMTMHAGQIGSGSRTIASKLLGGIGVPSLRGRAGDFDNMFKELNNGTVDMAFVFGGVQARGKEILADRDVALATIELSSIPDIVLRSTTLPISTEHTGGVPIETLGEEAWLAVSRDMPEAHAAQFVRWLQDYHRDRLSRASPEEKRDLESSIASLGRTADELDEKAWGEYERVARSILLASLLCCLVMGAAVSSWKKRDAMSHILERERQTERLRQLGASPQQFSEQLLRIVHDGRHAEGTEGYLLPAHRTDLERLNERVESGCQTHLWSLIGDELHEQLLGWLRAGGLSPLEYERLARRVIGAPGVERTALH